MSAPGRPAAKPSQVESQTVLVVDDSRAQRRLLAASLARWGFNVHEAESGEAALEICHQHKVDMVLSDWMMPGMSGLDLCRACRAMEREDYGYFILLTSKTGKDDVAQGLDEGADDFLTKPVNAVELRARMAAGQRILKMQGELRRKNVLIGETLEKLQAANASINRDLVEARKLQQSLVRERFRRFPGADLSLFLRPSGHVGGDLVGAFQLSDTRIGVYAIDVSGHGITSALITARVAGFFSAAPAQNVAMRKRADGDFVARPVDEVAERLNRLTMEEIDTENYFTLLYADIDLETGQVSMVQAGHPSPALQAANGEIRFLGDGGLPVGLIPDATYEATSFRLRPDDRLIIYSDGVSECPGPDGSMLEEEGTERLLRKNAALRGSAMLEAIIWDMGSFADGLDFPDDISFAMVEFYGPGRPTTSDKK